MKHFFLSSFLIITFLSINTGASAQTYAQGCGDSTTQSFFSTYSCGGGSSSYSCGNPTNCRPSNASPGCYVCNCATRTIQGNSLSSVDNVGGSCRPSFNGPACEQTLSGGSAIFCGSGAPEGTGVPSSAGQGNYLITISPGIRSITRGETTTYTVSITPDPGMAGQSINLALSPGTCPTNSTCSFSDGYSSSYENSDGYTYSGTPQRDFLFETSNPTTKTTSLIITNTSNTPVSTYGLNVKTKKGGTVFGPSANAQLAVSSGGTLKPSLAVDAPSNGQTITGATTFSGWAMDNTTASESAISSVKIYLDGSFIGNATYGTNRQAVCDIWPGRPGCPNIGWTYSWTPTSANNGTRTLTFEAIDSDAIPRVSDPITRTVNINVTTSVPVTTLNANPTSGNSPLTTTLTWSATNNPTSCTATGGAGGWAGSKSVSGSQQITGLTSNTTFNMYCSNAGGNGPTANRSVTVNNVDLNVNNTTCVGSCTPTLSWTSSGGGSCTATGGGPGWAGSKSSSGTNVSGGNITTTTTYTLQCGTATDSVTVTVTPNTESVTIIKTGQGTVTSSPAGINCGSGCSSQTAQFNQSSTVTLTATPATGRIFTGWSSNTLTCSPAIARNLTCAFTVNGAEQVTANFAVDPNYREF